MNDDKEYIISGTADQIVNCLVEDFGHTEDFSRFYIRISKEIDSNLNASDDDLNLWYLNCQAPSTTPVLTPPFSISYTELKKEIAQELYKMFGSYLISGDERIAGLQFVWAFLRALWKTTTRIEKKNLCVYYCIVEFLKSNGDIPFTLDDVIPYDEVTYRDGQYECNRHPSSWICPHCHADICRLNKTEISKILENLTKQGVLLDDKINKTWRILI